MAFNTRYHTGIAPLTVTEILAGLHAKSASQIEMPFAEWMSGYGLIGSGGSDDSDGDGIVAAVEFALGMNPTLRDASTITSGIVNNSGSRALELAYPIRLPVFSRYSLAPASSDDLTHPFTPFHPCRFRVWMGWPARVCRWPAPEGSCGCKARSFRKILRPRRQIDTIPAVWAVSRRMFGRRAINCSIRPGFPGFASYHRVGFHPMAKGACQMPCSRSYPHRL